MIAWRMIDMPETVKFKFVIGEIVEIAIIPDSPTYTVMRQSNTKIGRLYDIKRRHREGGWQRSYKNINESHIKRVI